MEKPQATITILGQEEYDDAVDRRMTQQALSEACIYLLVFKIDNGTQYAASVPITFQKIVRRSPSGGNSSSLIHASALLSEDYQPTLEVQGKVENDFVVFDSTLVLQEPVGGTIGKGVIVSAEDDTDTLLNEVIELAQPIART